MLVLSASLLFFVINLVNIEGTSLGIWLNTIFYEPMKAFMQMLHINTIKDGKLMNYVINSIPIIFEGLTRFVLAFVFLLILPFIGIFPLKLLKSMREGILLEQH